MGGGSSQPITIRRTATRPRPTDNTHRGIRVEETEGCAECKLIIDKGVTSASAKITINPEPTPSKDDPENFTIPDPTDPTGNTKVNPNIYIPSNSITITPSAPFTGSFNTAQENPYGIGQIQWDQMDLFWGAPIRAENSIGAGAQADACLLVRSTTSYLILMIPIQKTSDATKKGCKFFNKIAPPLIPLAGLLPPGAGAYDPNDDEIIAAAWKKLGEGDAETKRNEAAIKGYIKYASGGYYNTDTKREKAPAYASTNIDTGSDWALSSLVQGNEGYFTWIADVYGRTDDKPETEDRGTFRFVTDFKKWSPLGEASNATVGKLSPRIVYFQEPVYMLETDFAILRGTVKARAPGEIIQEIITEAPLKPGANRNTQKKNDPRRVFYHPACCGAKGSADRPVTRSSVAQTFAKVQNQQVLDMWNNPWFQLFISALVLLLMFLTLSWLLTYVTEVPDNIFVSIGRVITGPPRNGV